MQVADSRSEGAQIASMAVRLSVIEKRNGTLNVIESGFTPGTPLTQEQIDALSKASSVLQPFFRPSVLTCNSDWVFANYAGLKTDWNAVCPPGAELKALVAAVGKIQTFAADKDGRPYLGTGFLVADKLVMTNRHVVLPGEFEPSTWKSFGDRSTVGTGSGIKPGWEQTYVDFCQESCQPAQRLFKIKAVKYIGTTLDIAIVELERSPLQEQPVEGVQPFTLARPELDTATAPAFVAVVGFPTGDTTLPENVLFKGSLASKRFSPGKLVFSSGKPQGRDIARSSPALRHDASTLGGNSGSPLFDVATRKVIGVHYRGDEEDFPDRKGNYAVPVAALAEDPVFRTSGISLNWAP